jgi:hypothetical protein
LPRKVAPDHPEYGARVLLATSAGEVMLTIYTDQACAVRAFGDDGWTSGRWTFTSLDVLGAALADVGVRWQEAERLADEVKAAWVERWRSRESEVKWPTFELWLYGVGVGVGLPALIGFLSLTRAVMRAVAAAALVRPRRG